MDDQMIRLVAKLDMLERNLTIDAVRRCRILNRLLLLFLVEEFEDALSGSRHGLQHIGYLCQLGNRLGKALDILYEGYNAADFNGSVGCQHRADNRHRHISQIADEIHHRHHKAGQKLALPSRFVQNIVGLFEIFQFLLLSIERLDHLMTGECLLNLTVNFAQIFLLCLKIFLRFLDHQHNQQHGNRQNNQRNQRHERRNRQHHGNDADDRAQRSNQLGDRLIERLSHGIDIVGDARQHIADQMRFKISQRHPIDFLADVAAHLAAHFL